jgi:hypothetical protein
MPLELRPRLAYEPCCLVCPSLQALDVTGEPLGHVHLRSSGVIGCCCLGRLRHNGPPAIVELAVLFVGVARMQRLELRACPPYCLAQVLRMVLRIGELNSELFDLSCETISFTRRPTKFRAGTNDGLCPFR